MLTSRQGRHLPSGLYAITLAMTLIRRTKESNLLILSDSLSSLRALHETKFECDLVYKIIKDYSNITGTSKHITLACIPSHVGITGNEKADIAAKSALSPRHKYETSSC